MYRRFAATTIAVTRETICQGIPGYTVRDGTTGSLLQVGLGAQRRNPTASLLDYAGANPTYQTLVSIIHNLLRHPPGFDFQIYSFLFLKEADHSE